MEQKCCRDADVLHLHGVKFLSLDTNAWWLQLFPYFFSSFYLFVCLLLAVVGGPCPEVSFCLHNLLDHHGNQMIVVVKEIKKSNKIECSYDMHVTDCDTVFNISALVGLECRVPCISFFLKCFQLFLECKEHLSIHFYLYFSCTKGSRGVKPILPVTLWRPGKDRNMNKLYRNVGK